MDELFASDRSRGCRDHICRRGNANWHRRILTTTFGKGCYEYTHSGSAISLKFNGKVSTLKNSAQIRLILQVHDELVVETMKDELEQVKALVKKCMEEAAVLRAPLVADVRIGENWYQVK